MFNFIKKSLHLKILLLMIGIMTLGMVIVSAWELNRHENALIAEHIRVSRFMAEPILNAIYDDMTEERADLARRLIKYLGNVEGTRLQIVRSNGIEEAFKDLKTIRAVGKTYGRIRPEWLAGHPDEQNNKAKGVDSAEFQSALKSYREDWGRGPAYYIEKNKDGKTAFTYLLPIEKKFTCNACHASEEARGILMISIPMDNTYAALKQTRNQWIISGILGIMAGSLLVSLIIRRSITGPVKKNIEVIKRITDGTGGIHERMAASSGDEIGYLTNAFNNMLDALEKREQENKKLFELVAKSREEWMATFDAIHDLIVIHDLDRRVLKVNKTLALKLGFAPNELIGKTCCELLFKEDSQHEISLDAPTLSTGKISSVEVDNLAIEGTYEITTFPVRDEQGNIQAVAHVARDVTNEKILRQQLLHSEKISSVGKLVAGIAHELNNPLMGIMGFSQILIDMPGDTRIEAVKDKLRKIYHESLRTSKIVHNLLTFARTKKTEREYRSINDLLEHILELKEYSLRSNNIEIVRSLEPGLPKTMIDIYQIQQVFINILNNAEDSMTARGGKGRIEIKTSKVKGRIRISFTDNGLGIPQQIIHKVFDPFFTTKEVGKGTGLGLSITHGIVTEHGGAIEITSPEEGGAMVTVDLPIVEQGQWTEITEALESAEALQKKNIGEKVLVVDDEKNIREALADILSRKGFQVETARDGQEALDYLERIKFSLLLTDIKMPTLSGIDLYDAVQRKHPYLKDKTIILTGDVFSQNIREFLDRTGCPYILKPFAMKDLMAIINKLLPA